MTEKTRLEQLALIKQSVQEWNLWLARTPHRANLRGADLQGADLQGANLQDANLQDANLRGANLQDANLLGANLQGDVKIILLSCRIYRNDNYVFMGFSTNAGLMIKAGCRLLSPDDYRAHIAKEYPDTPKASETLRIIKYIEESTALGAEQ